MAPQGYETVGNSADQKRIGVDFRQLEPHRQQL
jgi:hypothetical protein